MLQFRCLNVNSILKLLVGQKYRFQLTKMQRQLYTTLHKVFRNILKC